MDEVVDARSAAQLHATEPHWAALELWLQLAQREVRRVADERDRLLAEWDRVLQDLGGDPARYVWSRFRPLRLSREEDWSDWLAHLLEHSTTGRFAQRLLGDALPGVGDLAAPTVAREQRVSEGDRRADLVITWRSGARTHIEVKIWDESFEKTFDTAEKLECHDTVGPGTFTHFVLVPPSSSGTWRTVAGAGRPSNGPAVGERTWFDVAVALRAALREGGEGLPWRVWAWSFAGAVEQGILGCPRIMHRAAGAEAHAPLSSLEPMEQQVEIMRRAQGHG
jgi:hypothetical protein